MGRLSGKTAIITGAGQGLGLGIAQCFASQGANLLITGRHEAKLEGVRPELEARGGKVAIYAGDAGVPANAAKAVQAAIDAFGRIDILINNAQSAPTPDGIAIPFEVQSEEQIHLILESGFHATIWHMQAAFPHLKESKGSVINLGSREGVKGGGGMAVYGAAKEAIRALSRCLAREWGPHGIRVNTINPASVTPPVVDFFRTNPDLRDFYLKDIPLGRFGDSETDIGQAALYLATDDSRYVTGQTLNVDGGMVML